MDEGKMKNMIIIKNLPSNIVDEAFIVLKSNKKIKALEHIENEREKSNEGRMNSKNYITKEAEMVISNYLEGIEDNKKLKKQNIKQLQQKYKRLRNVTTLLFILLSISLIFDLGGIIGLAF